jgi:4a-hydroxytetrahydrobiopterin dehydratase
VLFRSDKDNNPQWKHKSLKEVSSKDVDLLLRPLDSNPNDDGYLNYVLDSGYLKEWKRVQNKISRSFVFKDFRVCFSFMSAVAELAEQMNHHPEWSNVYNRLKIDLTTHDAAPTQGGAITQLDLDMAAQINKLSLSFF